MLIYVCGSNGDHPGPVNIGNPREFTIRQLAELVCTKINPDLKFNYKPLPQDDPLQRRPNIGLAKHLLGWQPRVELSEGLDSAIAYFKNIPI